MYEPEAVLRLKKDGKVVLTAEEAELLELLDSKGSVLPEEKLKHLEEYRIKNSALKDTLKNMYRNPVPTVDGIVLLHGEIVLVKRGLEPYKGQYALPGGFIEYGESAEEAVVREIEEETGLQTEILDLAGVFSNPDRDPRRHTISIVFFLHVTGGRLQAGDDASQTACFPLDSLPQLAFDHEKIIRNWQSKFRN